MTLFQLSAVSSPILFFSFSISIHYIKKEKYSRICSAHTLVTKQNSQVRIPLKESVQYPSIQMNFRMSCFTRRTEQSIFHSIPFHCRNREGKLIYIYIFWERFETDWAHVPLVGFPFVLQDRSCLRTWESDTNHCLLCFARQDIHNKTSSLGL